MVEVDLIGRESIKRGVRPAPVVEVEVAGQRCLGVADAVVGVGGGCACRVDLCDQALAHVVGGGTDIRSVRARSTHAQRWRHSTVEAQDRDSRACCDDEA